MLKRQGRVRTIEGRLDGRLWRRGFEEEALRAEETHL
jgi:hypothetical protein